MQQQCHAIKVCILLANLVSLKSLLSYSIVLIHNAHNTHNMIIKLLKIHKYRFIGTSFPAPSRKPHFTKPNQHPLKIQIYLPPLPSPKNTRLPPPTPHNLLNIPVPLQLPPPMPPRNMPHQPLQTPAHRVPFPIPRAQITCVPPTPRTMAFRKEPPRKRKRAHLY